MQHVQYFFVRAAVQRAVERGDGRGRGGIRINMRASDSADGVGGAVLFVIRVQDEEDIESALERGIRTVFRFRGAEKHVQKIARIAEFIVRIDERHSQSVPIRKCRNSGHLADEAVGLLPARFRVKNVLGVVIKGRKRGDRGDHHAHRVGVVVKSIEKLLDAFVDKSVMRDVVGPVL